MVDGIIGTILEIMNSLSQLGGGLVFQDPTTFNAAIYKAITNVSITVFKPAAMTILVIFTCIELNSILQKEPSQIGSWIWGQFMIRVIIALVLINSTPLILKQIIDFSTQLLNSTVIESNSTVEISSQVDIIRHSLERMGWIDQFLIWVQTFIVWIFSKLCLLFINVVLIGRMIEFYIYIALSPMAMAPAVSSGLNLITINFFKNFSALAMQGIILFLIFYIFQSYVQTLTFPSDPRVFKDSLWMVLGAQFILLTSLFSSSQLSRRLVSV